jgi:hypothetical protein
MICYFSESALRFATPSYSGVISVTPATLQRILRPLVRSYQSLSLHFIVNLAEWSLRFVSKESDSKVARVDCTLLGSSKVDT